MSSLIEAVNRPRPNRKLRFFSLAFGVLVGLALLKFGNPVILDKMVSLPGNFWEWVLMPWPIFIGRWLMVVVCCIGGLCIRARDLKLRAALLLPFGWFCWQLVAATQTVRPELTSTTLLHFGACLACFYLGYFVLGQDERPNLFFFGVSCGLALTLAMGFDQHFGGLEDTRKHFWLYIYPTISEPPPELLKRMSSDRIFGTLFYPNALAQAIILCLPGTLGFIWSLKRYFTAGARVFLLSAYGASAAACLVWTGSKGGWLVALIVCLVGLLHLRFARGLKIGLVAVVLAVGLTAFAVRFAGYFKRGATSAVARFDYWQAALRVCASRPLVGTGPGTFQVPYAALKRPEAEMARMAHNDYLQQASDSGLPGFVLYGAFIFWSLRASYPSRRLPAAWYQFLVWLGVLGWALHNLVEFGLYIPALSWPAFACLGWLSRTQQNSVDTSPRLA